MIIFSFEYTKSGKRMRIKRSCLECETLNKLMTTVMTLNTRYAVRGE